MVDMNKINNVIHRNYFAYCEKWDLTFSEKLLLKHYTEEVISKSVFREEHL